MKNKYLPSYPLLIIIFLYINFHENLIDDFPRKGRTAMVYITQSLSILFYKLCFYSLVLGWYSEQTFETMHHDINVECDSHYTDYGSVCFGKYILRSPCSREGPQNEH